MPVGGVDAARVLVEEHAPGEAPACGPSQRLGTFIENPFVIGGGDADGGESREHRRGGLSLHVFFFELSQTTFQCLRVGTQAFDGEAVGGDLVCRPLPETNSDGREKDAFIVAGTVSLQGGAKGPVTIYGNNVSLAGDFAGDVNVISAGRITLAASTTIAGALTYQAPEAAGIPASARVVGGVHYTGTSYLPTSQEARAIALAGFGVFLFVKILGALILAGLLTGLFPALANALAKRALERKPRSVFLTMLLGFAMLVATPVLLLLLAITFVGIGIAFLLGVLYILLILLAFALSSVIVGSAIARVAVKRSSVRWSDAVIGMLVFYVVWSIPFVGWLFAVILLAFTAGALALFFFRAAFPHDSQNELEI